MSEPADEIAGLVWDAARERVHYGCRDRPASLGTRAVANLDPVRAMTIWMKLDLHPLRTDEAPLLG